MSGRFYPCAALQVVLIVALAAATLFGAVRRFHPEVLVDDYPTVGLETHNGQLTMIWNHLPQKEVSAEKDGVIFQVWKSEARNSACETHWKAGEVIYARSVQGERAVNASARHLAVCQVSHPTNPEGSGLANLYLPCYRWVWREPRYNTRATCDFDAAGWVILLLVVFAILSVWSKRLCRAVADHWNKKKSSQVGVQLEQSRA